MSFLEGSSLIPHSKNPLNVWQKEMNNLIKKFNQDFGVIDLESSEFYPKLEIKEKDKSYSIRAEVPGMSEDDINVTLRDNNLILEGEKKSERKDDKEGYFTSEFSYGRFYRSIPLEEEVNQDSVKASYKNGLLTVDLEKVKSSTQKSKKIPILKS